VTVIRSQELATERKFFEILLTSDRSQIAVMTLQAGQASGDYGTDHPNSDQILTVLEGGGKVRCEGEDKDLQPGDVVHIPAGAKHQVFGPNRTLNVYSPAAYPDEGSAV
jgi:mannose-6-phosphate isomerase-like protein (cupin superfamily)